MAIRKFTCGHTRTVQKYRDNTVHRINGDCPACQGGKIRLNQVPSRPVTTGKTLKLKKA